MNRLTIEILLLALVLAFAFSAFEWSYRDKLSPYDYVFRNLESAQDSITEINIGNSHTGALLQLGLHDTDRVFNLGLGGQDLFHMMAILKKCLPDCPKIKTVVLGLDYDLPGYNFDMEKQVWKDRQYYPYTGMLYDSSWTNCLAAKSSFIRLNRDLRYLFITTDTNSKATPSAQNFIPVDVNGITLTGAKQRALEHSETKFNEKLIPENLHYLEEIILLCSQYRIHLIIANTPKTDWYVQYYNRNAIDSVKPQLTALLARYNLPYLDFFSDSAFTHADFLDSDHLNVKGANKFMKLIRNAVNE